jgi:predicted O-linked N-acetylglucosamine transferase (SPINDLY family)
VDLAPSDLQAGREALLAGDPQAAAAIFEALVAASPADHEARYWLASARLTGGDPDGAALAMEDARLLQALAIARTRGADIDRCRTDPAYAAGIATQLYGQGQVAMAGAVRGLALAGGAIDAQGLLRYGLALQHQGRAEEASQVFQAVVENFPSAAAHQFLVYPQLLCDDSDARHAAVTREWARLYAPDFPQARHGNPDPSGRKLRIGYLAPNFAGSQLRQFIAPVLESHDPAKVTVTLYPAAAETETAWPDWIQVHPIGTLSDADAADLIRRDGIDVLADCWGHSAGSRLAVFGRRPAPVQVAWINFLTTTGLEQIDYVLHADGATPADAATLFTESIWPLGPVFNAFRPASGRLPPAPTPALAAGRVTFGSFNHPAKLSDWTLDAWATVLRQAPTAVLLLKYRYFDDPVLQRATQARFAARGVAPERILFSGHTSGEAYFRAFAEIDLMLDAWPAPGSTTTLDALSNGVPVLTMIGAAPNVGALYARSILQAVGLADLVTDSPEAFVDRALELAGDLDRLDALRARVRPGFEASPICDEAGFTRNLEAAFAEMFRRWRARAPACRSGRPRSTAATAPICGW